MSNSFHAPDRNLQRRSHDSRRDSVCKRAATRLGHDNGLELRGGCEQYLFVVREPVAGTIAIEPQDIAIRFDPPMWVPSQRTLLPFFGRRGKDSISISL